MVNALAHDASPTSGRLPKLGLSTHNPNRMTADDVSKLAGFAYHNHPDIFKEVLAEQPAIVKFLSNPLVGAALGAVATK